MRVTHLLVKFVIPPLHYSWWNLRVQCNTCCLGNNILGWGICHQKTLALHSFALMHQYPEYCICIPNTSTLSNSFQRQSNGWHGYACPHHASCVNCFFLMRIKCLLCFLSVNWALIDWSIDCAIDGSVRSKRIWRTKNLHILTIEITTVDTSKL